jgi:translation initiation factor IF-3
MTPQPNSAANKGPQLLNDKVRATEVRLISEDEQFGVVSRRDAEKMAEERGLDLIIMSLDSSPPVVKMMDFGKFKFEKEKKAREAKKKQHNTEVKEIKLTVRIDKHDLEVKCRHAEAFLNAGHKVKVTIRLKGREVQHSNLAFDLVNKFIVSLQDSGGAEANPRMEGRQIVVIVTPGKKKVPTAAKPEASSSEIKSETI